VGVDTAGGGSEGDYACAQVIDRETGMQCAELHGHFPPNELGRRVTDLWRRYKGALVAVERNNHGHAVLVYLNEMGCKNIYEQDGKVGWLTTAASRPAMIENMAAILIEKPQLFHSPRLLEECRTFVRQADGSARAADGSNDDCVMAMAIALAVRREDAGRRAKKGRFELTSIAMVR
jgi:Terminase RNaseH-like domain